DLAQTFFRPGNDLPILALEGFVEEGDGHRAALDEGGTCPDSDLEHRMAELIDQGLDFLGCLGRRRTRLEEIQKLGTGHTDSGSLKGSFVSSNLLRISPRRRTKHQSAQNHGDGSSPPHGEASGDPGCSKLVTVVKS